MRPSPWRAALLVLTGLALGMPLAGRAQHFPGDATPTRPIRLEGYWDRPRSAPEVLGEITLSPDGRTRRSFGVTALQAYKPPEEGVQVLRHTSLQPITLLLRGREEMVQRLLKARTDEKVVAYGVYQAGSATFTLASVEIAEAPRTDGTR